MGYELTLEQQQKLIMTPELKLALKILQLPSVELDQLIQYELEVNPVLDMTEDPKEDKSDMDKLDASDRTEKKDKMEDAGEDKLQTDIDWREYLQYQGKSHYLESYESDEYAEGNYENMGNSSSTLKEYLIFQLYISSIEEELKQIGEFIIESLDENGYLTITLDEISDILQAELPVVEKVLQLIQTFEPYGVGARDLKECLLIQLKNNGIVNPKMEALINHYLDDIANNRLQNISKKLNLTIEEIQNLSDMIKQLEPKPGRSFEGSDSTRYVVPDIYIEKIGGEYIVAVNDYYTSRLIVNQYYKDILKSEDKSSQASVYISNKLSSAMWLIKSLEHRKNTLYNVMKAILDYQMDFFEKGVMFLKTMTLKHIADEIGVHESTVSRAVNGKYVQTPRGVFEIKYFFKSGVDNKQGDTVSSESIKKMIKHYITGEDNTKPISDQDISDALNKSGFIISRRTVAKYRDELGIPASSKRKRF